MLASGLHALTQSWTPSEKPELDAHAVAQRKRLEDLRHGIADADLRLCAEDGGDGWSLSLRGTVDVPADLRATARPLSLDAGYGRALAEGPVLASWRRISPVALVAFVAFRLEADGIDAQHFVLKLPAEGFPADRDAHVLRALFRSPSEFLRLVRALLGVIGDGSGGGDGDGGWTGGGRSSGNAGVSLEELLLVVARAPERLEQIRRLVESLRDSEEGHELLPPDFLAVWSAVEESLA